jgi:rhamnulokinase
VQDSSNYIAIDIGNSHVRIFIGNFDGNKLSLEEIYQFPNKQVFIQEHLVCNLLNIYQGIKEGLFRVSRNSQKNIAGIGIDSWGVDYILLDKNDHQLSNVYHHTDQRTDGIFDKIFSIIPKEEIYGLTGIQFINFNTLPQLYADLLYRPWVLKETKSMLFIADYFNFLLTGKKFNEFTMASTSQIFNTNKLQWETDLLNYLSLPPHILQPIIKPGNIIGTLLPKLSKECRLESIPVFAVATHDTASAVAALPIDDKKSNLYISLGTWSLLGIELDQPNTSHESLSGNFTNECGARGEILYHKILPGLWIFNQCINKWKLEGLWTNYQEADRDAAQAKPWLYFVNPNDKRFFSSVNDMPSAMKSYQQEYGRDIPVRIGHMVRGIYEGLALNYRYHVELIEQITKKQIKTIYIISGGSKAELLCQLTADITGKEVVAGLPEATVVGNVLVQILSSRKIDSWEKGKEIIKNSFKFSHYTPRKVPGLKKAYQDYKKLFL